ncbi:wds [Symbiodinium microadriaticum]|nr:wds [Symbiodinium microadriaticum]
MACYCGRSSRDGGYTLSSTLKAHTGTIRSVKFNPFEGGDCNSLVSGGAGDCRLRLWDVQQGSCMELAAHHDHIHGISWMSPQLILSGCESGQLIAHDTRAASVAWSIDMSGGVCALHCLADDGVGIVGHVEGGVSVLDLRERRVLATYRLHGGDVRSVAMWNESGHQKQKQATFGGTDGFFALTTSFDGKGCVWRLPSQLARGNVVGPPTEFRKVMSLIGHTDKILCGVHSPLTDDIFTSGADGNVMFWSPRQYHV